MALTCAEVPRSYHQPKSLPTLLVVRMEAEIIRISNIRELEARMMQTSRVAGTVSPSDQTGSP